MIESLQVLCFMFSKITCFNATEGMLQINKMGKSCQLGSQLIFCLPDEGHAIFRCDGILTKWGNPLKVFKN